MVCAWYLSTADCILCLPLQQFALQKLQWTDDVVWSHLFPTRSVGESGQKKFWSFTRSSLVKYHQSCVDMFHQTSPDCRFRLTCKSLCQITDLAHLIIFQFNQVWSHRKHLRTIVSSIFHRSQCCRRYSVRPLSLVQCQKVFRFFGQNSITFTNGNSLFHFCALHQTVTKFQTKVPVPGG